MTDTKVKKKTTGFRGGDENINRAGRPVGAKQKLPKIREVENLIAQGTVESVKVLFDLLRDDKTTDATKFKVASKFIDTHITIEKQGGRLRIKQEDKKGNVLAEAEADNNYTAPVVSFVRPS